MPRMNMIVTVSELNRSVRQLLEQNLPLMWVTGEISNFTRAASGHWYFSLKDDSAAVRCVMFRQKNQLLDWIPQEGMQVEARALVTLYEARGDFQLGVEALRKSGQGAVFEAFLRLKEKLGKAGLFEPERKQAIPAFPKRIGVITSRRAAALHDILKTLQRRMPSISVVIYPAAVQGEGAAEQIASAIGKAAHHKVCDTLILARGGGSIEDISAFNTEIVAQAIADCPIPIVCGVGHETDFTLADFVADRRAPTPTGAAELASPNREDLGRRLSLLHGRLSRMIAHAIEFRMQHVDHLARRVVHPREKMSHQRLHLQHLALRLNASSSRQFEQRLWQVGQLTQRISKPDIASRGVKAEDAGMRLNAAILGRFRESRERLRSLEAHLLHLNPQSVLARGYSMVQNGTGEIISDVSQVTVGEEIRITFGQGSAAAEVLSRD
ncbi:MAG: exodeoxyribonuclease VII large subunit [Burkholderiales bacterium]